MFTTTSRSISVLVFLFLYSLSWGQTTYTLVTSTTDLVAGGRYIIVNRGTAGAGQAMGLQNTNNRAQVAVTVAAGLTITATPATAAADAKPFEITLGGSSGAWTLNDAVNSTFLRPATGSSTNNYLQGNASSSTYTIALGTGAVITNIGNPNTTGRNVIQYNSGSSIFSSYTSGSQTAVYLFKAPSCTAPSTQGSVITFPSINTTSLGVNWTNGNGAGRVVIMNNANSFTSPTAGSNPTASTAYAGSGEQVIFNGTGSGPVTVTGLTAGTTYYFRVYEYCSPDRTYQTATATNNPNSQATTAGTTSIATAAASYGPFCNGTSNSISVAYTPTGTFTGTFYVQLSDASGVFPSNTTSNLIGTGSGSSPISASIPSGTIAGTGYRIRVINTAPATYGTDNGSNITINATPTTPAANTPAAVCEGTAATITGAGSTSATAYTYWTSSSSGSQITTGTTPPGTVALNNLTTPTTLTSGTYTYYVQGENGSCVSASRQSVTVTVNTVPADPTGSITVSANPSCGAATLSYPAGFYWQTSASGTSTSSPTSSTYSLVSTGTIYVRANSGSCWSAGVINTGTVTINTAVGISFGPSGQSVVEPAAATFTVASSGTGITHQWQVSTNSGGSWTNVSTGTGGTTNSYTTAATSVSMSGYQYRCVVTGTTPCAPLTSSAATLSVSAGPCLGSTFDASSSVPSGWSGSSANDAVSSHYQSASNCRALASGVDLITPATDYPVSIDFYVDASGSGGQTGTLQYRIGAGTWTTVGTFTASTAGATENFALTASPNLSTTANVSFRILASSNTIYIDDLEVFCGTVCTAPTTQASSLTFSGVTSSSLDLNFTRGNGDGVIIVGKSGSAATDPTVNVAYNLGDAVGGGTVMYKGTASGINTATTQTVGSLNAETRYYFNIYEYTAATNCYKFSALSDNVWTLSTEPTAHSATFNCNASAYNQIDLTFNAASGIGADGYLVLQRIGAAPTGLPLDGNAYTVNGSIGDATVIAIVSSNSATTQSITSLTGSTNYYYTLVPYNWNASNTPTYNYRTSATVPVTSCTTPAAPSTISDMVDAADIAVYTSNIDYTQWQSATISNTGSGANGSISVFKFIVRDGGSAMADTDVLPTILTSISFSYAGTANTIRSAALFNGNTFISQGTVTANGISFTALSGTNVTANDNNSQTLTLRVTFNTNVTDNEKLVFSVASATAGSSSASSQFTTISAQSDNASNDRNRMEVTATKLAFVQQPSTTPVSITMTPSVTVSANDANGNRDLDYASSVSVISTGTLTGTPVSAIASGGLATFALLTHTAAGTGLTLTASSGSLTIIASSTFDITTVASGSYRTTLGGTWPSGTATWERFNGSTWVSATPSASTTDMLYIRHAVTSNAAFSATGGVGTRITVENGGSFSDGHSATINTLQVNSGGSFTVTIPGITILTTGGITVESGGTLVLNSTTLNHADNLFQGTENFKAGSTVEIQNFDYDSSPGDDDLIDTNNPISTNSNGYYFGNLFINNLTATTKAMVLVGITGTQKLCENNLTVTSNAASTKSILLTNVNANVEIGGNVIVNQNLFAFGAVGSSDLTHTINGNLILNNGTINFNQTNSSSSGSVTVNLLGNLECNDGTMTSADDASLLAFAGTSSTQSIDVENDVTYTNLPTVVKSGAATQLITQDFKLGNNTTVTILNGGTLDFNYNTAGTTPLNILETSSSDVTSFDVQGGGTIKITNTAGITSSGTTGNVQTDTRTYNAGAIYHYIGKANQVTGNGLPTNITGKVMVELNTNSITLTPSASRAIISGGELNIKKGTLIESNGGSFFDGAGTLIMTDGLYQIATVNTGATQLPRLSGAYTLTGGTIELNGNTNTSTDRQTLRGAAREYYNVKISGASTAGYKNVASAMVIKNNLEITGSTFDLENNTVNGNGGITMSGGLLRMAKVGGSTLPQLSGTATAYSLTGGKIEFYGTTSSQDQVIRSTYNGNTVTYYNLDINASSANTTAYNVKPGNGGFNVSGAMNVYYPAVLQINSGDIIAGSGTFTLNAGATLKYADAAGIVSSGNTGAVRTASRTFPTTASYGFVGGTTQNAGSGLPNQMVNMYVQKDASAYTVTLPSGVRVDSLLTMTAGNLNTGSNTLELGKSTSQTGILTYTSGHVIGIMKRWFGTATNSGDSSSLFPIGTGTLDRFATVEYRVAPSAGGSLTARFVPTAMGLNGLPLNIAAVGSCAAFSATSTENTGYWQIDAADGLTAGNYDISLVGQGFTTVTDLCQLTALKRVGGGNWMQSGTQTAATGTLSRPVVKRLGASGWSNWGFGGGPVNPLPVELISFTGKCSGSDVLLEWSTASEQNSERFIVEKSSDLQTFEYVNSIPAAGNSNQVIEYQMYVPRTESTTYFRLREEDFDGAFEYFGPVSATCDNNGTWQVYAVGNILYVSVEDANLNGSTLAIYDMNGRSLYNSDLSSTENATHQTISLDMLPSGLYWVDISHATQRYTYKVIITN